jgi:hypothetical protein
MVAIAACQAHHRHGQQVIEFGAPFIRSHAVGVQGIGSAVGFSIVYHDPWVPDCAFVCDLGTGQPIQPRQG